MVSTRFRTLSVRIRELRKHFLPAKFDPTGTYQDRVHEHARAFRLLAHAEFEAYIEDRVSDVVTERHQIWKDQRLVSRCIVGLVSYHDGVQAKAPSSILSPPQKPSPDLSGRISAAVASLTYHAKTKNHGIKEDNLLRLLMPIGFEEADFDQAWLATVESWATKRGTFAHQSKSRITEKLDPEIEYKTAKSLLEGFKKIDLLVEKL